MPHHVLIRPIHWTQQKGGTGRATWAPIHAHLPNPSCLLSHENFESQQRGIRTAANYSSSNQTVNTSSALLTLTKQTHTVLTQWYFWISLQYLPVYALLSCTQTETGSPVSQILPFQLPQYHLRRGTWRKSIFLSKWKSNCKKHFRKMKKWLTCIHRTVCLSAHHSNMQQLTNHIERGKSLLSLQLFWPYTESWVVNLLGFLKRLSPVCLHFPSIQHQWHLDTHWALFRHWGCLGGTWRGVGECWRAEPCPGILQFSSFAWLNECHCTPELRARANPEEGNGNCCCLSSSRICPS